MVGVEFGFLIEFEGSLYSTDHQQAQNRLGGDFLSKKCGEQKGREKTRVSRTSTLPFLYRFNRVVFAGNRFFDR
jgi:hypothetical protein